MDSTKTVTDTRPAASGSSTGPPRPDMAGGLRVFLVVDLATRLLLWCGALTVTTAALTALRIWPARGLVEADLALAGSWALRLALWILLFNCVYVLELLLLRLPIPMPKEGRYSTTARKLAPDLIWSCLIAVLTKARYAAPFPGFLVFQIANLPPFHWLTGPIFGPRSRSCYITDPRIVDPHLVTIGRNVVMGMNTSVLGHYQERDAVVLARTIIENDVVVGGDGVVFGGVHIKRGSMTGAGSVVLPGTVIGPNEFWAGVPAQKVRDLPPLEPASAAD